MPALSGSEKAPLYALADVGRAGATRAGYVSSAVLAAVSGADGSLYIGRILRKTLEIEEITGSDPNTATFMIRGAAGFSPSKYAEVVLTLGTATNTIFAGHILQATRIWNRKDERFPRYRLDLADYAWLLATKRVWGLQWTSTPINEIAQTLVDTFAPGFTALIAPSLPAVTFSANQGETVAQALSRLCQMVATARWYVDYDKVIHVFTGEELSATRASTLTLESDLWNLEFDDDGSQARTRTYVQGASTRVTANIAVGATSLAVAEIALFSEDGGGAVLGSNRITYTGITLGSAPAGTLTGVPASGPGSVLYAAANGDAIAILEASDDSTGINAIEDLLGNDGVIEHVISDAAVKSADAALIRGQTDLLEYSYVGEKRLRFYTRDTSFRANRRVTVELGLDGAIASDEPIAGWPLDDVDTGSTTAADVTGHGFDLTVTNPLPAIPGPIGGQTAAALDGTGDPLLERAAFQMPSGSPLSLEIWHQTDALTAQALWTYNFAAAESIAVGIDSASLIHVCINGAWLTLDAGDVNLADGDWHQVLLTWNQTTGALIAYVDGEARDAGTLGAGATLAASGALQIGQGT